MKILPILITCFILNSCSQKHWITIGKKHGWLKTDSVSNIVHLTMDSSSKSKDVSAGIDSIILKQIKKDFGKNPEISGKINKSIQAAIKNLYIAPVTDSTKRHITSAWIDSGKIKVKTIDLPFSDTFKYFQDRIIQTSCNRWKYFWPYFAIGFLSCAILFYIVKKA